MTDHQATDGPDSRAENAFRAAFERVAEAGLPEPLDSPAIRRKSRTRSTGLIAGAAAAVLLLIGGAVGAVQLSRDAASTANDPADQTETSAIEAPAPGWRFEYYRDVRLQVPNSWGYDREPGSDWCADVPGGMVPERPYVARSGPSKLVFDILCRPGRTPVNTWVDHVTLSNGQGQSTVRRVGPFRVIREPVGHVTIKIVSTHRRLADRILASAEIVEPDDPSCDPSSEIQAGGFQRPSPAFDITALDDVDAMLVCQYTLRTPPDAPALIAQYELVEAAAEAELRALQAAPIGGGPDRPETCGPSEYGDSAIVLHLVDGDASDQMYVYYSSCRGNGFDDGTAIRALTREACPPLIQPPISLYSGSSAPFGKCAPD